MVDFAHLKIKTVNNNNNIVPTSVWTASLTLLGVNLRFLELADGNYKYLVIHK